MQLISMNIDHIYNHQAIVFFPSGLYVIRVNLT